MLRNGLLMLAMTRSGSDPLFIFYVPVFLVVMSWSHYFCCILFYLPCVLVIVVVGTALSMLSRFQYPFRASL